MGLLSGKLPKKITPIIGGKKYPRENVISVTPSQERRIAGLLGHKGRVGLHGIKHYPPVSNSDAGVAETKATGGTGNVGNTGASSDRGTTGMQQGSNSYNSQSNASSRAGNTGGSSGPGGGDRGTTGMQQGSNSYNSPANSAARSGLGGQGNTNSGPSATGGPMNVGRGGSSPGGGLGFGVDPASVARVTNSLNSLLGNRDKNLNYGYGTPGNPVPALNNRNPLQGNAPGSPNAYDTAVTNLVNAVKPLSVAPQDSVMRHLTMGKPIAPPSPGGLERYQDMTMGGKFGLGSTQLGMTPPAPQAVTDPYGGMGKFGINSGQTSPYNQPSPIAADPQMAGRLAETRLPGYGVPDLPQRGQVVAKTPGERVNLPSSGPQQLGSINDMLGGLNSGWNEDQIASRISYPSEEGQIYGPASLANYNQPKIADRVPQYDDPAQERASIVNQWRQNQFANNSIPRGNLNPATPPVSAGMGPTFGPETPAGTGPGQIDEGVIDPASHYSPQVQTTASKIQGALDAIGQGLLDNTPGGRLVKGGMWLGDQLSGGPAYRDDVSLGTDESGRRTDRAPSGNGYSPGGFGPGGGDRRGGSPISRTGRGSPGYKPPKTPGTDPNAPPVTPPVTPPPVNMAQWYYPEYQSQWAGLPVGLGGTYGRA